MFTRLSIQRRWHHGAYTLNDKQQVEVERTASAGRAEREAVPRYDPAEIEPRRRAQWEADGTYRTPAHPEPGSTFYCLNFFPYPSGAGLSVGHGRNYVPTDVVARHAPHARPGGAATRWGGMPSACRPKMKRSRATSTRGPSPAATPPTTGGSWRCWAAPSTGSARSIRASRSSTAGRSGSSCCCTGAAWHTGPRAPVVLPRLPDHPGERAGGRHGYVLARAYRRLQA